MLEKNAKIFIAGHRGLVGSAIWNNLRQRGYTNLVGRSQRTGFAGRNRRKEIFR